MKTQRVSPFPVVTRRKTERETVDASLLKIDTTTPPPGPGTRPGYSKYDDLFPALKPGHSIVCEKCERELIRNALVKWLKRKNLSGFDVVSQSRCDDGHARVWLIKKDTK